MVRIRRNHTTVPIGEQHDITQELGGFKITVPIPNHQFEASTAIAVKHL